MEEKRDRSDMWTHERKHYLRHLDLEEHVEATRGHKEKYLRGGSPSAKGAYLLPAYKMREDCYRKSSKQKSDKYQNQTLDVALKSKRKEETRSREHKHSHCEDTAKEEMSEQKSIMMPDTVRQKQSDKDKLKDNAKKAEDMSPGIAERNNVKKGKENGNENEVISTINYHEYKNNFNSLLLTLIMKELQLFYGQNHKNLTNNIYFV